MPLVMSLHDDHSKEYFTHIPTEHIETSKSTVTITFSNVYSKEKKNGPARVATVGLPTVTTVELFHIYLNII